MRFLNAQTPDHDHDKKTLIILDFAGTLSIDTVLFAREESLTGALAESGLAAMGIKDPETFFKELIAPTWEEGSTTTAGYANILSSQIKKIFAGSENCPPESQIRETAAIFTRSYFASSGIDPHWQPVLDYLGSKNNVDTVIASDHYAEATGHILKELADMGIEAVPAGKTQAKGSRIIIANSADLGFHKSTREFWTTLERSLGSPRYNQILLIDDFGFNEQEQDLYGGKKKALTRREQIIAMLKEIFSAKLNVFPFFLEDPTGEERLIKNNYRSLIEQAGTYIKTILE